MNYFKDSEFACKCGKCGKGIADMQPTTLARLVKAREVAAIHLPKVVFILDSAMRCEARNKKVGGVEHSSHLTGYAVDIRAVSSTSRYAILVGLLAAGFTRIGIGKNFLHADDDPSKPPCVIWEY